MKVAYLRVSTDEQLVGLQLRAIEKAIDQPYFSVYCDIGKTGRDDKRPQLQALLKDISKGYVNKVVIYKLDRFFRNALHLTSTIAEWQRTGIEMFVVADKLDLITPIGVLMYQFKASLAEFESALISERVKAGMAITKETGRTRSGKPIGRPKLNEKVIALVKERLHQRTLYANIRAELGVGQGTIVRLAKELRTSIKGL